MTSTSSNSAISPRIVRIEQAGRAWARSAAGVALCVAFLAPFSCAQAAQTPAAGISPSGPPAIKIHSPSAGDTADGATPVLYFELSNLPAERVLVHIESGNTFHNFLVDPEDPWVGVGSPVHISDTFLLFPEGERKAAIHVLAWSTRKPLLEETVSISVAPPKPEDRQEDIERSVYRQIVVAAQRVQEADEWYRREVFLAKMGDETSRASLRGYADKFLDERNLDFCWRIGGYALLSEYYERNFQPKNALLALQCADEIFQKEKGITSTGQDFALWPIVNSKSGLCEAPLHFFRFARYYARRDDIGQAVDWLKKEAEWYEDQAKKTHLDATKKELAAVYAARAYRVIAQFHMIVKNDVTMYEAWMEKFKKTLPPQHAAPHNANRGPVNVFPFQWPTSRQ